MKQTAYGKPIHIINDEISLINQVEAINEASIQNLVYRFPSCLPISEIDESYNPILSVCTELNTPVGPLDILMISPTGELAIIETKLWRNPEARRVVIAQILDYAKELSKWTYEDLQREVNKRLKTRGNILYNIAKKSDSNQLLNEADFVDTVSRNLKRGKFLLLVVGDGIREGASGIAEFLISSGYMNFTFAMIEFAVYKSDTIGTIMLPRILAKTVELQKFTVDIPNGFTLQESSNLSNNLDNENSNNQEWENERSFYYKFWSELVSTLVFDDPGQPLPKTANGHNLYVYPGKTRKVWISSYFMKSKKRVGVYLRCKNDIEGQKFHNAINSDKEKLIQELGDGVIWNWDEGDSVSVRLNCEDVFNDKNRQVLKEFFYNWLNKFVNSFRPRIKEIENREKQ